MKKTIAFITSLCICSGVILPASAYVHQNTAMASSIADEEADSLAGVEASVYSEDDISWTLDDDGTLTVSGKGSMGWWGIDVDKEKVKKIVVEEGITNVNFKGFSNLETVTLPDSLTRIGDNAFYDCISLKDIKIPDNVTEIEDHVFSSCNSLESITLPESITSIGSSAFAGCTSLESIILPESVTSIGSLAFGNCVNLEAVEMSGSVTSMGNMAFLGTKWLENKIKEDRLVIEKGILIDGNKCGKDVVIPDGVKTIAAHAFGSKVESIIIPESVENIGEGAFIATKWLEKKQEEDKFVVVNCILVDGTSCTGDVVIPDSVTRLCENAFYQCDSITSLTIPRSVTKAEPLGFLYSPETVTILNPECEIDDDCLNDYQEISICGYENSTAQEYADKSGFFKFIPLDEETVTSTTASSYTTSTTTTVSTTPKATSKDHLAGDANCDGGVDLSDVVIIMQALAKPDKYGEKGSDKTHITTQGLENADVVGNDGMTTNDAQTIQKFLLKLVKELPVK